MNLEYLRATLFFRSLNWKWPETGFKNPPKADHTPVLIGGGIGDLILGLGVAEALNRKVGDVVVYTKWPDVSRFFSKLPVKTERECTEFGFDFVIYVNSIVKFSTYGSFEGFKNEALEMVYLDYRRFNNGEFAECVRNHPHLDNRLGHLAGESGLTRETLPYSFLGLQWTPRRMPFGWNWRAVSGLEGRYITVHDGFDGNNKDVKDRSMKNWDLKNWATVCRELKIKYPCTKIIQLGGPTSRRIEGVDECLIGKTDFVGSMKVLDRSMMHIDGDSGLVHAANILNVPCIVLFGPTNRKFFGYAENVNLAPDYCGDCWWLEPNWMSKCPIGHETPKCMDSITPQKVLKAYDLLRAKHEFVKNKSG